MLSMQQGDNAMFDKDTYTAEQKIITDFVHQLARNFGFEYFLENMKNEKPYTKYWNVLGDGGYFGLLAPEAFGGSDFKTGDLVVFFNNLAKKGLASHQIMNQVLCCAILAQYGSTELQKTYLPELISGKKCSYAVMEQGEGISLFDIRMDAVGDGDTYRLNGMKDYVAGAGDADCFIIAARTRPFDGKNKKQGISLFVVDAKTPGITVTPKELNVRVTGENEMMMITGDAFCTLAFDNVVVSSHSLLGLENSDEDCINAISSLQMIMMAAISIGWGENMLDMGVEHARNRAIFEDSIGSYQAIQHPMARAKTDLELAKLATERAVAAYDNNEAPENVLSFSSVAKYTASEAAYSACDISMQAHGGSAFDRDMGIISMWPLILLSRIIPLNNDMILERFSETVLGLPPSKLN